MSAGDQEAQPPRRRAARVLGADYTPRPRVQPAPAELMLAVVPAADARYVRVDRIDQRSNITCHLAESVDSARTVCGLPLTLSQRANGSALCRRCQILGRSRVVAPMSNTAPAAPAAPGAPAVPTAPSAPESKDDPRGTPADRTCTVYLLVGAPGSGKSTWTDKLWIDHEGQISICSADLHFVDPVSGDYRFDPRKLGDAHAECLREYATALVHVRTYGRLADANNRTIVVDNTNTSALELAPYVALGAAYGAKVRLVSFAERATADECVARGTHGVPEHVVRAAHARTCKLFEELPPFWACERVLLGRE